MKRGTSPGQEALTEVAGSAFQHRNLKGGGGDEKKLFRSTKEAGPGCRRGAQGPAGIPRRRVKRTPRSARQGPGPRARRGGRRSAAPGAQGPGPAGRPGSARSTAGAAAAAPGSLPPAGGAF